MPGVLLHSLASSLSVCAAARSIFSGTMPVSALFEFVAVTEWPGAPAHDFDLRTSFPVRGLKGIKEQTLEEAGLCLELATGPLH